MPKYQTSNKFKKMMMMMMMMMMIGISMDLVQSGVVAAKLAPVAA